MLKWKLESSKKSADFGHKGSEDKIKILAFFFKYGVDAFLFVHNILNSSIVLVDAGANPSKPDFVIEIIE